MALIEAVIAVLIGSVIIAGLVAAFTSAVFRAEASIYHTASQALALQGYEQVRGARWDAVAYPFIDQCEQTNFPPKSYVLDVPPNGGDPVYATNFTTIKTISTDPMLKLVRVDCVYAFQNRGLRTNTIVSYRGAESGQQNSQEIVATTPTSPPPATGTTSKKNNRGKPRSERDDDD